MTKIIDATLGNNDERTRLDAERDPLAFWDSMASGIHWFRKWNKTLEWDAPYARWFVGGTTNASYNALDVHAGIRDEKPAILWEGEDGSSRTITYAELLRMTREFAGALYSMGVRKGDRVAIYLPMVPEIIIAMLACARIGAIHTVIFSGFSSESLRQRIEDSGATILITADGGFRRGRLVPLKSIADGAVTDSVRHTIVLRHAGNAVDMGPRDTYWHDVVPAAPRDAEHLPSDHPLFILYTSGTTGRPKGVLHGTGGYLTHIHATFRWAFDILDSDVYFCTADIGWVTGHSYVAYAPLMHGATIVIYEGAPDHPDASRTWQIIQKYGVTIFYTTPTALRMLKKAGDPDPAIFDLKSIRLLGTVGEPINPEVWLWYWRTVGKESCPVIDTWWQTETGGMLISALPGLETIPLKPGSGTRPVPGVDLGIVNDDGADVEYGTKGHLVIKRPWPGMLLGLWNDDAKYREAYWSRYPGAYHTGDYCVRDEDGYYWLLGRADDILKVAGHRIGTAELESCIVSYEGVAESAVCTIPDEITGEAIVAYVVLRDGITGGEEMRRGISGHVREKIGPIATPRRIYFARRLPKTRSGKIMRRLLRTVLTDGGTGDTSTLEDGGALDDLRLATRE